ncbi:MAG: hypothetical protein Q7U07_07240 [Gammaproteobacteria bacterium]|nr:hypothetical protein [Gammaproteobacteria bacterium]
MWAAPVQADTFVRRDIITDPTPGRFSVCSEHTCHKVVQISLAPAQWQQVRDQFSPSAESAADERMHIARAIALMEALVGPLAGTSNDKGRNFKGVGTDGQMDCIDESTNTTSYLTMMAQDGLITQHSVEDRVTRGFIFFRPHTTAVIRDNASGERFAVDSWFLDNGEPPFILPLPVWQDGWEPTP